MRSDDCVFCGIANGKAEASVVHEDAVVVAFLDINPVNEGHVLIAPKEHLVGLADLSPGVTSAMVALAQRVAAALGGSGIRCEGVNLMYADGAAAGQEVFHSHLHVIPRFDGDSLRISANWGSPPRATLDSQASRIAEAMERAT